MSHARRGRISARAPGYDRRVHVNTTTRIACPPEEVFDMLADLRNDTQWNSRVSRAELRSPEPIGLGSRFAMSTAARRTT